VYRISADYLSYKDGLLMDGSLVLDDHNQPYDTLGKRRLHSPHKLRRLNRPLYDIADIIKSGHLNFIDFRGKVFHYRKTVFSHVKYKKIRKIEKKEIASLLWAEGVNEPFLIARPPQAYYGWVGILYLKDYPWKIYDYSETFKSAHKKKI